MSKGDPRRPGCPAYCALPKPRIRRGRRQQTMPMETTVPGEAPWKVPAKNRLLGRAIHPPGQFRGLPGQSVSEQNALKRFFPCVFQGFAPLAKRLRPYYTSQNAHFQARIRKKDTGGYSGGAGTHFVQGAESSLRKRSGSGAGRIRAGTARDEKHGNPCPVTARRDRRRLFSARIQKAKNFFIKRCNKTAASPSNL